jgi:quinol monooxygenase YgiN
MDETLTLIAHVRAKPGQETGLRQVLEGLVAPTRAEAGCSNYDLHPCHTNPALFVFYENWKSDAHLEAHGHSAHIQSFRKLASEILAEPVALTKWKAIP